MDPGDPQTIRTLARLARLELSAEEVARLVPELRHILEAFRVLARHELGDVPLDEGAAGPRTRRDEPVPSLARETLLEAAAEHEDGFFRVPKTVGGPG